MTLAIIRTGNAARPAVMTPKTPTRRARPVQTQALSIGLEPMTPAMEDPSGGCRAPSEVEGSPREGASAPRARDRTGVIPDTAVDARLPRPARDRPGARLERPRRALDAAPGAGPCDDLIPEARRARAPRSRHADTSLRSSICVHGTGGIPDGGIAELYTVERVSRGAAPEERLSASQEHAAPIFDALEVWPAERLPSLSGLTPLAATFRSALDRLRRLRPSPSDGRLAPDNNAAERAMRGAALGRKNWIFAGSAAGSKALAIPATLIGTAKLNRVDPHASLADTLACIPHYNSPVPADDRSARAPPASRTKSA